MELSTIDFFSFLLTAAAVVGTSEIYLFIWNDLLFCWVEGKQGGEWGKEERRKKKE